MRRLAKFSRGDTYSSTRDYQHTEERISSTLFSNNQDKCQLNLNVSVPSEGNLVFGGYFKSESEVEITFKIIKNGEEILNRDHHIGTEWSRIGYIFDESLITDILNLSIIIEWQAGTKINFWGVNAGILDSEIEILPDEIDLDVLSATHLAPETFYLDHDGSILLELMHSINTVVDTNGESILVKKCSYCNRKLPIDMSRLGALAFNKHNAKKTKHQNECRACKKWRINDTLNPRRTTDQLHESSVITRERRVFLRDPEILRNIKERDGAGLKSQVWERFDKKCFYCQKPLELSEVRLDHTRPLAYLWPIDEHATCLCEDHNGQKSDKFPVDFYSETQLRELSRITGLAYEELTVKKVNYSELERIISNIENFAITWEPRTFQATARKILELQPDCDLFELLKSRDESIYNSLIIALNERPS